MKNSEFKERFIEVCGTSQPREIGEMLEISYQAAKNYLNGRLPDSNVLRVISEKTPYSIHWLLTGEGEKFVKSPRKNGTPLLTDEMRAFVRRECVEVLNELLGNQEKAARQKIVVLTSDQIKEEKVIDESVTLSVRHL
ncbi:hypothetical protein BH10ACI1_BH10ACI1_26840 [soil metagenome]